MERKLKALSTHLIELSIKSIDFTKIQLNRLSTTSQAPRHNRGVINTIACGANNLPSSRLKRIMLVAARKIRLIRSKRKSFQIPLDVIRKARTKFAHPRYRGKKKPIRSNWVYRWIYKDDKRILFRIKLGNAVLVKKKYISLSKEKRVGKEKGTTIHIRSTYNNTLFTLSGCGGKTICCIPTGMCGFKNTRKSTSYASQVAAQKISVFVKKEQAVRIKMCGLGPGKLSGVKSLAKAGVRVSNIRECSSLPHNGCRPTKRRRL